MTPATQAPLSAIPPEVLAFAAEQGVRAYLTGARSCEVGGSRHRPFSRSGGSSFSLDTNAWVQYLRHRNALMVHCS
jgi:hypothetical protein